MTGTDENAQKNVEAATKAGEDIFDYVDRVSAVWQETWKELDVSNDDFIRTTEERHHRASIGIWQRMEATGDIYLGKISKWNDPAIKALNPTLALPDAAIAQVRRADGSGTTFIFTNYLSKVNAEWKAKVGEGTAVNWPVGAGGKGNEGVAAFVARLPNSIGYVEYSYVKQNKMTYTLLKNKDGQFVAPDDDAFKAAAVGADWNKSFYQLITDQPGKGTWPISTATFILMHIKQDKPANAAEVLKFFNWAYANGAKAAADLDYVPMPPSVIAAIQKSWGEIKDGAGKPVAFK